MNKRSGIVLVILSVLVAITFVVIASFRDLSALENTLLQVFSLGLGLVGSYILGQASANDAAVEMVKPHARSAFRRLVSLTQSLSRQAGSMGLAQQNLTHNPEASAIVERMQTVVIEQISIAADALEDWRDVLPEELDALRAQQQSKSKAIP